MKRLLPPGFPPDISSRQNRCALWLTGLEGPENPDQFGGLGGMLLGRAARLLITLKTAFSCLTLNEKKIVL